MSIHTEKVKEAFAKRLHDAMDKKGYPVRGRARILSKEFKISDKGAGKWLNGEAIPETSKLPVLASFLGVSTEWLLTGTGKLKIEQKDNFQTKNNSTLQNKVNKLDKQLQELIINKTLSDDQLKIIEGMIDGINATINSWLKPAS